MLETFAASASKSSVCLMSLVLLRSHAVFSPAVSIWEAAKKKRSKTRDVKYSELLENSLLNREIVMKAVIRK